MGAKKEKSKDSSNLTTTSKKKKKKVKCFYCGKQGHIQSECQKRVADEKNGMLKFHKKESSNSAQVELELFIAIQEEVCSKA
eukprot:c29454_g1_i1 orf=1-243(-)